MCPCQPLLRRVFPVALLLAAGGAELPPSGEARLKDLPVTTVKGEAGDLLRKWWKEGTAAGNVGDWYDNRDGGHSDLDTRPYPQLQRFEYTKEDVKAQRHWAAATVTRPHVTFGNSSTSAPPQMGGSNVRLYYGNPRGLPFLYQHYTHNNLYIYPEHRDHDPGHNGKGDGYGDLYPANTPYVITSQGSSGSDQPFLQALPLVLAAFRPEVKKKLIETGLLMPTVQMIFRSTNKHLTKPEEYLTGKAHPSVFEGAWVDPAGMVKMAHEIEPGNVPPMVQLQVVDEDESRLGRDFFELTGSEQLADTPAAIARVWRGKDGRRRLVVRAADSYDLNKRPLKFHWVVLRGDASRIKIRPRNEAGSVVEIVVPYHPRRPVVPGSPLESNRVDIGVFVHNGVYYSAPGFLTFFSLDSEARTYAEDGRVLEIGYGMGETTLSVANWDAFFAAVGSDTPAGKLLRLTEAERAALIAAGPTHQKLDAPRKAAQERQREVEKIRQQAAADLKTAQERHAAPEKAHAAKPTPESKAALDKAAEEVTSRGKVLKTAEADAQAARKAVDEAAKAVNTFLDTKLDKIDASPRALANRAIGELLRDPELYNRPADAFAELLAKADAGHKAAVEGARKQLVGMGVATGVKGNALELRPLRPGAWTDYEKAMLERFHAAVLRHLLYPGVLNESYQVNLVDFRLTAPKAWRDVYRYDAKGRLLGWTRYDGAKATDFNPAGCVVLAVDGKGRCARARTVTYEQAPMPPDRPGPNTNLLRHVLGDSILTYAYDDDDDVKGHVEGREPVDKKK
jgi:YD repeat-containing protein